MARGKCVRVEHDHSADPQIELVAIDPMQIFMVLRRHSILFELHVDTTYNENTGRDATQ